MDSTAPVPLPSSAAPTRARPTAMAPPSAPVAPPVAPLTSPYWSAFDQELMDTVLFSGLGAQNPLLPLGGNARSTRLPMHSGLLSPSAALRSGGILVPPLSFVPSEPVIEAAASAIAASVPFVDDAFERLASPVPSYDVLSATESSEGSQTPSSTSAAAPTKPKRRRKYNDTSRAKHREVQRRFIVRKKERMEEEKKLAFQMEKQIQFHTLKTEAEALERERSSLLQQCVASGVDLDSHDMDVFLEEEMETLSQYYKPLHAHESSGIMQQTLRYIDGFCPDEAFLDDGQTLGGWSQQCRVEHKTISFRFRKEFPDALAAQVFERTGYSMATTHFFPRFFGASVVIKTRLLQVIDLNTVVIYRAIYHPVTKEISRSVDILCRVQRGDSYLVLLQSLEGLNIQNYVGTHDTWTRGVVWCRISPQQLGSDAAGCMIQWTGCVGQCPIETLEHWSNDLKYLVLRYEGLVIAPLVTVAIQDDPEEEKAVAPAGTTKRPREESTQDTDSSSPLPKQSRQ